MAKLKDLTPDNRNANKGTARGQKQIVGSIQRNGFGRSGLLDKDGRVIAGNKTLEASAEVFGVDTEVVIVESDGTKPVYIKRVDLSLDDPSPNNPARRLAYEDNVASWLSFELDPAVVMADIESGFDFEALGVSLEELGEMMEGGVRELLGGNDPNEEWKGMPEYENEDAFGAIATFKVHFASEEDIAKFAQVVGQNVNKDTTYIWFPKQDKENLKAYRVVDEP